MGSHLTNDDLVGSRMREDYTWTLMSRPKTAGTAPIIDLIPKPDAPIVWEVSLIKLINVPKISYWNEREVLMREMSFHDYREIEGKLSLCGCEHPDS